MKTTNFSDYAAPTVDVIEVAVENGIATTGGGGIDGIPVVPGPDFGLPNF